MTHFTHWLAPGALLAAAVVFALLGRWQLDRAAWHRAIEDEYLATTGVLPLTRAPAADEIAALRYRPIRLQGSYAPASQILLDNMTSQGQVGYQVLTPFRADSGELVLVNRGWVPASGDRRELPEIALAGGVRRVVGGRIDALPRAALALGDPAPPAAGAIAVLSYPDYSAVEAALGEAVARFQLKLDPAEPDGFERRWAPPGDRDERSIAYAVQWFALAVLALGLAAGVLLRRRRAAEAAR